MLARSLRVATGLAADKIKALEDAGVKVAKHPEEIPSLLNPILYQIDNEMQKSCYEGKPAHKQN